MATPRGPAVLTVFVARLEEGLIALLLAVMTSVTFAQVVARYVFNYSFVWALELVTWLFAWLIMLGMAYGVRVGSHIGVDALVKQFGKRLAHAVAIVAATLCLAYALIFLVGGYQYVAKMFKIGILAQDMPIPQWVPRLALPVGFGLLALRFSELLFRLVTGREQSLHLADEATDALKHFEEEQAEQREGGGKP